MEALGLALVVWILSALTLTTGVGAGVLYSPMFVVMFGLDITTAVGTSLVIQLAGVGTTAFGHHQAEDTDRELSLQLGSVAVAGVIVVWLARDLIPEVAWEVVFVAGMLSVGIWLLMGVRVRKSGSIGVRSREPLTLRRAQDGTIYDFCRPSQGFVLAWVAGVATGGLGVSGAEVQISSLIARCRVPMRIAIGTGTVAAAVALVVASAFAVVGRDVEWSLAVVAIPAAVVGSLSARIGARGVPERAMRVAIALLVITSALGVAAREVIS